MADVGGTRYEPSRPGLRALAFGPDIARALDGECARGLAFARSIAPRSRPGQRERYDARYGPRPDPRRYGDSFVVEPFIAVGYSGGPRPARRLGNTNVIAAAVEFGNAATPRGRHVIGRTAAFLGAST